MLQRKNRILVLLISIVSLIILYPYLQGSIIKVALFTTLLSITLISSAYVLSYDRKPFAIALILGIPALLFTWLGFFAYNAIFAYASSIFTIAFYTFTLCMILSYVFNSKKIATAEIYGAVCVYLLMGITWGILYSLTEQLNPGSFVSRTGALLSWSDFVYFSFATLTTAGYGDIIAITARAQSLAILEMVAGVLYIAVLVARLVSLYGKRK